MKRVATVGAKICKSKVVTTPSNHHHQATQFASLSELAEHHGVYDETAAPIEASGEKSPRGLMKSPATFRALQQHVSYDNIAEVFDSCLSLSDTSESTTIYDSTADEEVKPTTLEPIPINNIAPIISLSPSPVNEKELVEQQESCSKTEPTQKSLRRSRNKRTQENLIPPQAEHHVGKKTIVLDLDETLIKSFYQEPDNFDFTIEISFPHMGQTIEQLVYIKKRPGLEQFLTTLHEKFELVMFTAALPVYANEILKFIDPDSKFFTSVLYRQHCKGSGSFPGKDLSLLGRDLDKTLLIDDGVLNFMQPNNGFLIKSFRGEEDDRVLLEVVTPFLLQLDNPEVSVYDMIEKYRSFYAVTYGYMYTNTVEYSHYMYYLNLNRAAMQQ